MMIDEKYQNNGYGTRALELCIEYIKSKPFGKLNHIILTCNIENNNAIHVYKKLGFKDTGNIDGDEMSMKLII